MQLIFHNKLILIDDLSHMSIVCLGPAEVCEVLNAAGIKVLMVILCLN